MSGRRGGGRGGRGSSSSSRGGGNRGGSNSSNTGRNNSRNNGNNRRGPGRQQRSSRRGGGGEDDAAVSSSMRDEDILIAFMPFLKGNHVDAARIWEDYQTNNDQRAFLRAARALLERESSSPLLSSNHQQPSSTASNINDPSYSTDPSATTATATSFATNLNTDMRPDPPGDMSDQQQKQQGTPQRVTRPSSIEAIAITSTSSFDSMDHHHHTTTPYNNHDMSAAATAVVEQGLGALLLKESDPIIPLAGLPGSGGSIWGAAASPITPPRAAAAAAAAAASNSKTPTSSPWDDDDKNSSPIEQQQQQQQSSTSSLLLQQPQLSSEKQHQQQIPATPSPPRPTPTAAAAAAAAHNKREAPPPKRIWTHFEEQPGRILVNGVSGEDPTVVLPFGPRQELTAHWSLPVDYLQQHQQKQHAAAAVGDPNNNNLSLDQALQGLAVGLFRRGCTENGQQASIISKENTAFDYWHDPAGRCIRGKIPFYSPRTPGNVLFRMYWEKDPLHTLAMGPSICVRVLENDFESSVRFILANFKGRKSNPTSLSSLHSLATVLETPLMTTTRRHDTAARTAWGCIQEARKVIDTCYQEYIKTSTKMAQLEEKVEELKKQVAVEEEEETKSQEISIENGEISTEVDVVNVEKSEALSQQLHEKTRALISGRASCERKWRDSQLAFASILKSVLTNPSGALLRRDLITRMRLEYELWCPLSEEFAVPRENAQTWYECINELPQSIGPDLFRTFQNARIKMQMRTLGFDVNTMTLEDALFPRNRSGNPNQRSMDPGAVNIFNTMSAAMGLYYQDLFRDEEQVVRKRELIRQRTEKCVQECGAFPPGTEVVIFGSSANGFGSPKSDLDMCLHLPTGAKLHEEDGTGAQAMAKLAEYFEKTGMKGVDTCRLTARIPIIMYHCPDPLSGGDSEEDFVDCDLSMHNPLAVLNTSLLRSYAEINPVTRVLASIIKRWAKARDINDPARHTLSSYGYIIMLLHFLTYHKRTGNGLVSPVAPPEGDPHVRNQRASQATPLLPNLQWMDQSWPNMPKGTPYRDLPCLPRQMMKHPMKDSSVNTFFYKPNTPNEKAVLQMLFPGQDLSLAILLASFFRYYAYEFDYKRHVVSLHSTAARGIVEREVKAELDGWRNYSAALAIEDPFELDYDIAHVLRGGYYHRIRREFALAYTKIADAASGRPNAWNKGDLRTMDGKDLIDWICEPVLTSSNDNKEQQPPPPSA